MPCPNSAVGGPVSVPKPNLPTPQNLNNPLNDQPNLQAFPQFNPQTSNSQNQFGNLNIQNSNLNPNQNFQNPNLALAVQNSFPNSNFQNQNFRFQTPQNLPISNIPTSNLLNQQLQLPSYFPNFFNPVNPVPSVPPYQPYPPQQPNISFPISDQTQQQRDASFSQNQPSFTLGQSVFEKYAQKTALDLALKELKPTDGCDPHALLKVIRKMLDLHSLPSMSDPVLYSIILPFTKGGLKHCVKTAIKDKFSFDSFHSHVLNSLIPLQLRDRLKMEYYSRYQKASESFSTFVAEIKIANKLLKLNHSQKEVIQTIIHYCAPEERARFVFAEEPRTYQELQVLCEKVQSFKFAETARQTTLAPSSGVQYGSQSSPSSSANNQKSHPSGQKGPFYRQRYQGANQKSSGAAYVASESTQSSPNSPNNERKPQAERKCYRCGDSSHLIRNCPHPKNETAQ